MTWLEYTILNREFLGTLRSPKSFISLFLFLLFLTLIVYLAWPEGEGQITIRAEKARQLFKLFAGTLLVLTCLIAPIFSASSITMEKERHTMELLLITLIPLPNIVFSKFVSSVLFLVVILVSSYPVTAVCYLMGGIGMDEILTVYALTLTLASTFAMIGVFCSCHFNNTYTALCATYLIAMPVTGVFAYWIVTTSIAPENLFSFVCTDIISWMIGVDVALYFSVVKRMKDSPEEKERPVQGSKEDFGLVIDRNKFPDRLISPPVVEGTPFDTFNPVYYRELHYEILGQGTMMLRWMILLSFVISLPFMLFIFIEKEIFYVIFMAVFAILIAPPIGATAFTKERERGSLDILLTTPIEKHTILIGKFLCIYRYFLVLLLFISFPLIIAFLTGTLPIEKLIIYFIIIISLSLMLTILAMGVSLVSRTTLNAMITTYIIIIFLFIVPVVLLWVLYFFTDLPKNYGWITATSPFSAIFNANISSKPGWLYSIGKVCIPYWVTIIFYLLTSCTIFTLIVLFFEHQRD